MRRLAVLMLALTASTVASAFDPTAPRIFPGAEGLETERLEPYDFTWQSWARGAAAPEPRALTHETLIAIDGEAGPRWRHTQVTRGNSGAQQTRITEFDAETLRPISAMLTREGATTGPSRVELNFHDSGYTKRVSQDGETTESETGWPVGMYYGPLFGVVLAALPLADGYVARLPSAFPAWDGMYWQEIRVSGPYERSWEGRSVLVWNVDVEWLNLGDGDIYPAGADESGGAYEMVVEPGDGLPLVWRYVHSGVDILPQGVEPDSG